MVMLPPRVVEREVKNVRVRIGLRGRLVVQVQRRTEIYTSTFSNTPTSEGVTGWSDASASRPNELAEVIRLISSINH